MKKNATAWIACGIGAAILLFAFTGATSVPPSAFAIALQPGMWAGQHSPASGQVAFILPAGATWIAAQRGVGTTVPLAIAVPVGTGPLVADVGANIVIALQWKDASGATATAFYGFV